ncbi:MAG: class I SAM-dependent methyltransferase [Acetobacteraceae bacterium]|nr:class I SAM-dependent methyltransferase [Acetobacteraceae bacterium]
MAWIDKLLNVSVNRILIKLRYEIDQRKYLGVSHSKVYDWDWNAIRFNRIALVNSLIAKTKGIETRYLEIGCAGNDLFDAVACISKIGVDPASGGTHRMLSDDFFATNTDSFDVIFIDGLHHYDQVKRDTVNALKVLNEGGWIAYHDFLPADWKEHHVPRIQSTWTGDCWKVALELTEASGLEFKIAAIDHGVGVLRKTGGTVSIPDYSARLNKAEFDVFIENFDRLPIADYTEVLTWISNAPR